VGGRGPALLLPPRSERAPPRLGAIALRHDDTVDVAIGLATKQPSAASTSHHSLATQALVSSLAEPAVLDGVIAGLAERIADAIAVRLAQTPGEAAPEWLDSRGAAEYLGLHGGAVRKLAAGRAIPAEQEGPGCRKPDAR
jgi:hypothetical protein